MVEVMDKPNSPKNGDTKIEKDGTKYIFRNGSWVKQKSKPEKKSMFC